MERREALTIRFPGDLLERARGVKTNGESLNELVVQAVEREVKRRRTQRAFDEILRIREEIRERDGVQSDSTQMIRDLRDGIGRRE